MGSINKDNIKDLDTLGVWIISRINKNLSKDNGEYA
jgi:hypothetical protein